MSLSNSSETSKSTSFEDNNESIEKKNQDKAATSQLKDSEGLLIPSTSETDLETADINSHKSPSLSNDETSQEDFYLDTDRKHSSLQTVELEEYSLHLDEIAVESIDTIPEYKASTSEMSELEETHESDITIIDRQMYYELYKHYKQQHKIEKMKNNFLQSRLASYYSRRKMMYVLREQTVNVSELQNRYEKEIDALEQLIETSEREKSMNLEEIVKLKTKRDLKSATLEEMFKKFQQNLMEYGKTLTVEKTGKSNMDKITEKFVKRQKTQLRLIKNLRLKYIQLRNKLNEKLKALDELDHLGPGFRIMDYVQLKIDNRDLHDKLEEKESELIQLRKNCQHTMQVLAHNREKTQVADLDKEKLQDDLEEVDRDLNDAREQLHYLKQERDGYRDAIKQFRNDFGLLTNRKLLKDMCVANKEINILKNKLEKVQLEYKEKSRKVIVVRKNLEYYQEKKNRKDKEGLSVFSGRSSSKM